MKIPFGHNSNDFFAEILRSSGAKVCKSCRSRQELSHGYLLAKIGFDTAEKEHLEVRSCFHPFVHSPPLQARAGRGAVRRSGETRPAAQGAAAGGEPGAEWSGRH